MKRRKLLTALFLLLAACALALGIAAVRRAQRLPSSAGVRVPVLMYHAVGDDCWGEESLFVKPEELEKQLQYLSENGYETIFFEDLSHIEQYEKPVLLTFDDGYDDNAETLLPLLQKYGMKATIFLIAGDVGKPHKLTRAQLAELVQSGLVSIQSHGWSHRNMAALSPLALLWELVHDTVQRRRVSIRQVVGLLLVPLGFAAYCCINRRVSGNPFQFLIYQREHWNQRTGLFFSTAAYQTDYLLRCLRSGNWRDALGLWLPNLIACFSALILLAKAAPRLRASQTAWFLAYYIIAVGATWLLSAPRYLLVLLPVPLALAQCVQKRTANIALTALSALAALGYLIAFALRWQVW